MLCYQLLILLCSKVAVFALIFVILKYVSNACILSDYNRPMGYKLYRVITFKSRVITN